MGNYGGVSSRKVVDDGDGRSLEDGGMDGGFRDGGGGGGFRDGGGFCWSRAEGTPRGGQDHEQLKSGNDSG